MKKIIVLMIILLISSFCLATAQEDTLWKGYVTLGFDKEQYNEDENITGWVVLNNEEYFPAFGSTIIVQLNQGYYNYPSQFAKDNILDEIIVKDNWTLQRDTKKINFSFKPHNAGTYHVDVYAWVMKSMLNGGDSILINPRSETITVNGTTQNKNVFIQREKTMFENTQGPVGFPKAPGESFSGIVVIENKENYAVKDLDLRITLCDWSCALKDATSTKTIPVSEINANSEKEIIVDLLTPQIPSAYEIKIELIEGNNVLSQYKNRIISTGGTAKIRKMFLNGVENNFELTTLLSGSPDHFNYPDFEKFDVEMKVYNNSQLIEQKTNKYDLIKSGEVIQSQFDILNSNFSRVCVEIKKDNVIYENECINTPIQEAKAEYTSLFPKVVNVKWNYLESSNLLTIDLEKQTGINSVVRIIKEGTIIFDKTIKNTNKTSEALTLEKGIYILTVDDIDAKRQIFEELNLGSALEETTVSEVNTTQINCTGQICQDGFVCDSTPYLSNQGACCNTNCVPSIENNFFDLTKIPFILWIAILLLLFGIIILVNSVKKLGGNK